MKRWVLVVTCGVDVSVVPLLYSDEEKRMLEETLEYIGHDEDLIWTEIDLRDYEQTTKAKTNNRPF